VSGRFGKGTRLGQNFLVDRNAASRIVDATAIERGEAVVEIGPGRGALTEGLISRAGRIAAVELDESLVRALEARYPPSRLLLVHGDILDVAVNELPARLGRPGAPLVVVGNLPYQISKPLALRLVGARSVVDRAVLMFQKEVAQRLTARPGTREYGPLGIVTSVAYTVRRLFDLGPAAFRPRPKVASTVTLWHRADGSSLDAGLEARLRLCLGACFARRRQTLRNNLRAALGSPQRVEALLEAADLDGSLRAEVLEPERFLQLARLWPG
jgi:16S rRNA (adenine1518-N6/adenine1519-N6)-dimethyltransferase